MGQIRPKQTKEKKSSLISSKNKINLTLILIYLLIFLLPTQLGKHFFFDFSYLSGVRVDYLAPTLYLTDIIALVVLLLNIKKIFAFIKQNKKIVFVLLFLLLNVFIALSPYIAVYRFIKILEFTILLIIISQAFLDSTIILWSFFTASFIQLFLVVFQFVNKHSLGGVFYFLGERNFNLTTAGIAKAAWGGVELLRPYGTFSHPNSLAGFYLVIFFYVLTDKNFSRFLILKSLSLFVFTTLIFMSFSKLAITVYLLINIIYLISHLRFRSPKCLICSTSKSLTIVVVAFIFLQTTTDPLSLNKRLTLFQNSLTIIKNSPVLGVGLGNYLLAQNKIASPYPGFLNQPVHNIYLLVTTELGIFLGGYLIYQFLKFLFDNSKKKSSYFYLLLVVTITGLFDHYWLTLQQNWLILSCLLGIMYNKKTKNGYSPYFSQNSKVRSGIKN